MSRPSGRVDAGLREALQGQCSWDTGSKRLTGDRRTLWGLGKGRFCRTSKAREGLVFALSYMESQRKI